MIVNLTNFFFLEFTDPTSTMTSDDDGEYYANLLMVDQLIFNKEQLKQIVLYEKTV